MTTTQEYENSLEIISSRIATDLGHHHLANQVHEVLKKYLNQTDKD